MNLDNLLIEQDFISISFRKKFSRQKYWPTTDKSQRPEFINTLFNRLNNRPEGDALFSRIRI